MPWTTRTCVSCGIGLSTTWPSNTAACSSTTTPNFACLRSERWRRWQEPRSATKRTTSLCATMGTKPHVRSSATQFKFCKVFYHIHVLRHLSLFLRWDQDAEIYFDEVIVKHDYVEVGALLALRLQRPAGIHGPLQRSVSYQTIRPSSNMWMKVCWWFYWSLDQ